MITRAIGLMIIVGDHETLQKDENWEWVIKYISNNGAMQRIGKNLNPRIRWP